VLSFRSCAFGRAAKAAAPVGENLAATPQTFVVSSQTLTTDDPLTRHIWVSRDGSTLSPFKHSRCGSTVVSRSCNQTPR
jgi:hypothetical protein